MTYFSKSSYPFTTKFFRWDLPKIPKFKPSVFQEFRKYSLVNDKIAKEYLINTEAIGETVFSPVVDVDDLDPGRYGETPPTGDIIYLDKTFLGELDPLLRIDSKNTEIQARAELLLEATVLHELVHYIRRVDGGIGTAMGDVERALEEKVAQRFEIDAYGQSLADDVLGYMTVGSLGLAQFMPKTALRTAR